LRTGNGENHGHRDNCVLTARLVRTACGPSAFSRCELETLARGGPAVSEWTRACPPGRNDLARPLSLNSRSRMRRAASFDIPAPGRMICSQISASALVDATDTGNPVFGTIWPKRTLQRGIGRWRRYGVQDLSFRFGGALWFWIGRSAKVWNVFCAGDFSAGCKLLGVVEFGIWVELPVR
jgi:hypothetical protein